MAAAAKKVAGRISKGRRVLGDTTALQPPPRYEAPDLEGDRFLHDSSHMVIGIRGPFGSGKSVLCVHKIMKHAQEMPPWDTKDAEGKVVDRVRRSRWAVVRNTFPELKLTTVKTWLAWVPDSPQIGEFAWSAPYTHYLNYMLPDGTRVEAEVIFLALDDPKDVKKLLSLDLTGIWVNEAREIDKEIIDTATSRIGRWPSPAFGGCPLEHKIFIMDTNSPPEEHWWPIVSGEAEAPDWMTEEEKKLLVKPSSWKFYTQPPAMLEKFDDQGRIVGYEINPGRANKALPDSYYEDMITGKTRAWINVYVLNRYDTILSGRRVYPEYSDEVHLAKKHFEPNPNYAIHVGIDYGRQPAAVFMQYINGRLFIFHEFVMAGVSTRTFGRSLKSEIARQGWHNLTFSLWGDPSGDDLKETEDVVPSEILRATTGLNVRPAPTNDFLIRTEAISSLLTQTTTEGVCVVISPRCLTLIAGFRGGYHYKQIGGRGSSNYDNRPSKNRFSHPHDGLQYGAMGAGAWRPIVSTGAPAKVFTAKRAGSPFQRHAAQSRGRSPGVSRWSR